MCPFALHNQLVEDGNSTVKRLMERADLNISQVSCRTVQCFLHSNGSWYLHSRKKGVLLNTNFKKRLQFHLCPEMHAMTKMADLGKELHN